MLLFWYLQFSGHEGVLIHRRRCAVGVFDLPVAERFRHRDGVAGKVFVVLLARRHADLAILPEKGEVGRLEFYMLEAMRDAGRRAALSALENAPASLLG